MERGSPPRRPIEPVAVGDEPLNLRLPVSGGLLFDGLGEPLHRTARAVVHLEQHLAHPLERLLHALAGADRALFPSFDGLVGLFDGSYDAARIDFEDDGFLVHVWVSSDCWIQRDCSHRAERRMSGG